MADDYSDLSRRSRDLFSGRDTTDSEPDFDPRPPSRVDRSPSDDRDQTTRGSREPSGGGGGGGSRDRIETVSGSTTVGLSQSLRDRFRGSGPTIDVPAGDRDRSDLISDGVRPPTEAERERIANRTDLGPQDVAGVQPGEPDVRNDGRVLLTDEARVERGADATEGVGVGDISIGSGGPQLSSEFRRSLRSSSEDGGSDPERQGGASRTARTIDAITDGIQRSSPAATAAVSGLATSFRSESGVPIPGTNRSLPGREDFRNFRQRLESPAQRVDSAIGSAVDRTTIDPENAPFELEDIPLTNPTTAAVGATLGTEAGQRGAQAGVERGLESFNPARAVQDASLFAEFGVRGSDRVLDAEEEEIDEGIETGTEVAGTVREEGPEVAAATVAQDPSTAFEAGTTAATVGILGAAGPSAAGSAARAGRRAAGDAIDSGAIRRTFDTDGRSFVEDTRGQQQLIQRGRSRQRSGGGDDELGPPRPRTDEVRDRAGIQRDRARRGFGQGRDGRLGRGRGGPDGFRDATFARDPSQPPEPEFTALDSATRRLDGDFETPRDPLDTRGGGFGAIETGATVGGALGAGGQADLGGLFDEGTAGAIEREIVGETTGDVAGTGTDTRGETETDPFAGTDTTGATDQGVLQGVTARTRLDAAVMGGQLLDAGEDRATVLDDPATGDPVPQGVGTPTNAPRPPRSPDIPTLDPDSDEELFAFGSDTEDEVFGSGIADADDILDGGR